MYLAYRFTSKGECAPLGKFKKFRSAQGAVTDCKRDGYITDESERVVWATTHTIEADLREERCANS